MNNNKYVFIVEDSVLIANHLFNSLSENTKLLKIGFANNGKDALKEIIRNPPDVVLLDLGLPDRSGLDVLRKIKEQKSNTAVVVLTNNANNSFRKECKKLGAVGFYDKSHEFDEAIEKVKILTTKINPNEGSN